MLPSEFEREESCWDWRDYRLVSREYVWSWKRLLVLASALCLPCALPLPVNVFASMGVGLGVLVVAVLILGPRINSVGLAVLFAIAFGIGTTALMVGDSLLFPQKWAAELFGMGTEDALGMGALFTGVIAVVSAVAWVVAEFTHDRLIFRENLTCIQCQYDLIGHDGDQCPKCSCNISFTAMEIAPVVLRQLGETRSKSDSHPLLRRLSLSVATAGAIATTAFVCSRPYHNPPPSELTVGEFIADAMLSWMQYERFTPGSAYELFAGRVTASYGWPFEWLRVVDVKWKATKDGKPIPIDDEFIVQWIAEERAKLTNIDGDWLNSFTLLRSFIRLGQLETFPSSYRWEINWLHLYADILFAALIWYVPFIVRGVRRGIRLATRPPPSSSARHPCRR